MKAKESIDELVDIANAGGDVVSVRLGGVAVLKGNRGKSLGVDAIIGTTLSSKLAFITDVSN